MLHELAVVNLGVIEQLRLLLGPGMTALTGETGAGKTMVVEAIELLMGGRADPLLVRAGMEEATVEGRFDDGGEDVVLTRVIVREGRSRAYVNGRMATASTLAEVGSRLVDLHGQHDHQSLLHASVQRAALDRFGAIDLNAMNEAADAVAELEARLREVGGDVGARAREVDLLRFQVAELDRAALTDGDEDHELDTEESLLADAVGHRMAAAGAVEALTADHGVLDTVGDAIAAIAGRAPFADEEARLRSVIAELGDVGATIRERGERIDDDPERLTTIRERRQLLVDLRRKYGTAVLEGQPGRGTLDDVMGYAAAARDRLGALQGHEQTAAELEARRGRALADLARAEAAVGAGRRAAAPALAATVQAHLAELAMAGANVEVEVDEVDPGNQVRFLLAANRGSPALPLARTASGGELARTMLALRLVLSAAPPTLVFDEVDAGIGGAAALAVGRSLATLGADHQVLVVTHLPQVAAWADAQVTVVKTETGAVTSTQAMPLGLDERIVELSRMLSGTPGSAAARDHAAELLASAAAARQR